jgi:hypothetical protein
MTNYTPPQEMLEKSIKDAWYTCLQAEFLQLHQRPPKKGEIEKLVGSLSDEDLLILLKASYGFGALPPSLRQDTALIQIVRASVWV